MSYRRALTESQIEKLPISFGLFDTHGGWIRNFKLTRDLQTALRDAGCLKHLSLKPGALLSEEHSICYAILSKIHPKNSRDRQLQVWRENHWESMIGLCFLYFERRTDVNTVQIGVTLLPECRHKGYGRAAVHKLLAYAFDALKAHRVFAHVVCPTASARSPKEQKQALFDTKQICHIFQTYGFQFEGVTRGAIMTEIEGVKTWEDIHRLSILDTDWLLMQMSSLSTAGPSPGLTAPNPWEEMEQRHEAEREEMLGWCEKPGSSNLTAASDDDDDTYYCSGGSSCSDD